MFIIMFWKKKILLPLYMHYITCKYITYMLLFIASVSLIFVWHMQFGLELIIITLRYTCKLDQTNLNSTCILDYASNSMNKTIVQKSTVWKEFISLMHSQFFSNAAFKDSIICISVLVVIKTWVVHVLKCHE